MGTDSRFFNRKYVWHSIKLKTKAIRLRISRKTNPYVYFIHDIDPAPLPQYELSYIPNYLSLAYLDLTIAKKIHPTPRTITQNLILGLVAYNSLSIEQSNTEEIHKAIRTDILADATLTASEMKFIISKDNPQFNLSGRYVSGIVQGKAASYFLRVYSDTKDSNFKELARKSLIAAWPLVKEGGARIKLPSDLVWIEEYPSDRPSMVLNGFLFYFIGLSEYLSLFEDGVLQAIFDQSLQSIVTLLPYYKLNGDLLYSMYRWNLCNVHYTAIMYYQFEHLYQLTSVDIFKEYQEFCREITPWKTFESILK